MMSRLKYVGSKGPVTRGNFSCNLQRNAVARQVAEEIARVTPPLCNLQRNKKLRDKLQEKLNSLFATLRDQLQRVTPILQLAMLRCREHCETSCKKNCLV